MMWLVIWTDGEYHKTIMVDLESGQIQEPTDAQAAIGDLMSESDFVATVMNAYYYQPLEYEGEALIWGKVDFASGIRETFSFPDL